MIDKLSKLANKAAVIRNIKRIQSRDFSILASNCTGTLPYRFLDIPYTSPTVNLFFFAPCYMKFVQNLDYYLNQTLSFASESRYLQGRMTHAKFNRYPIGVLDDIEIHFVHYESAKDASEKWHRRAARINRRNLVYSFTDRDLCTSKLLEEFARLPGKKILLTAKHYPWIPCAIQMPAYRGQPVSGDSYTKYHELAHVDFKQIYDGSVIESASDAVPVAL